MYDQPLKVTASVKLLGVHIVNHLSTKLHVEHIERASLISRMRITKLNSSNATILIRLYKRFLPDLIWIILARLLLHLIKHRDKN